MARVLFGTTAGHGHLLPLLPLAQAFADAGHDVAFAAAESYRARIEAAGHELLPVGLDLAEVEARFGPYRKRLFAEIPPLERRPFAFRTLFGLVQAPGRLDGLRAAASEWRPDLIVHESGDLAAPIVAALLDIRSAQHAFGRLVPRNAWEAAAEDTAVLWRSVGLEPEPLCGAFRGDYLDVVPESFQADPLPGGVRRLPIRPTFPVDPREQPPPWLEGLPDRPLVYVTLGTVLNDLERFQLLLGALADLDCTVIATVGRDNDPAALAPLPDNAIVEQYVSQSFILPRADAVVAHGGSGSTLAALAHGLPTLLLPGGADQFDNAGQARSLGVARMLMPDELTADAAREAVVALLEEPSYRSAAQRLAAEIAAMPSPDEVVPILLRSA